MATIIENDLGLAAEDFTPEDMAFFQDYMNKQRDIMSSSPTTVSPEEDMLNERYFQVMEAALARKEAKAAMTPSAPKAVSKRSPQKAARELAVKKVMGDGAIDPALEEVAAGQSLVEGASTPYGSSEASLLRDIIPNIPVSDDVTGQSVTFDDELVNVGSGMTMNEISREPKIDLSGQSPATIIDIANAVGIPTAEYQRQRARESFNMMDDAGIPQEYAPFISAPENIEGMTVDERDYRQPEDFNVVSDVELSDTGMIPKKDYYPFGMMDDNFGKLYQPDVSTKSRGVGDKVPSPTGRKTAAEADPLDYVSPTGDADFAAIDAELGRKEAPVRQSTRAADNILESMLAEQNQAKEYMQLMPSIDMLRRQISGIGNRDQALANLESRIKSAKSASDLFSLDADVRNVGGDVARSRDSFVDALGTGSQTAQKMFELEASKPASRKKLAIEMFDAMQAPELVSYGDDFREYLGERPEVRVQYSKALSKQAEKLRLAASKDSDNAVEYNKALLEIKKTQAEIKKLEAERKKIQAVTKKTLSSAKSKGKGANRAQQTTILKEIFASQRRAPEAKLKEIEKRLALLGTQGIFDDDERKEIKDLNKNAMKYRDQIRRIGNEYLRVEQDLAKGDKAWSEVVDSIGK